MKKVVIYGGAFNPPTVAHQAILQACADYAKSYSHALWLLPSGSRSDKHIEVSIDNRLVLIDALIQSIDTSNVATKIEQLEIRGDGLTQTHQTFRQLLTMNPEYEQVWVFGSDSIQTLKTWEYGEWMYKNLQMLVVERPGYGLEKLPPNATLLPVNAPEVSSTLVRSHIEQNKDFSHLVPRAVLEVLSQL